MKDLTELLVPIGAFAMLSWVVYTVVEGVRRWHQQRTLGQSQVKLLDKIGSVDELGAFLNTEGGTRFLTSLALEGSSQGGGPQLRILRAVQAGAVLLTLGVGLFLYGAVHASLSADSRNAVDLTATMSLTVGVGLLVSAVISYRLSRQMGLINGPSETTHERLPTV